MKCLEKMSSKSILRDEIAKNGGIKPIVQLIDSNDEDLCLYCLKCLIHFAIDKKHILSFKQAEGLTTVLETLKSENENLQNQGIQFFQKFIQKDELSKEITRVIGFIPQCIQLLQSKNLNIQKIALDALENLSTSPKCNETIRLCDGLRCVLPFINSDDLNIQKSSISIISSMFIDGLLFFLKIKSNFINFAYFSLESAAQTIIRSGNVNIIVKLLNSSDNKISEAAARVICPLCNNGLLKLLNFANYMF